ncbi:MAG: PorV/PorQ family protein [Candidatus Krumholzibacteria bacterium]|nr:PorV/PorQ family protein [Candidatus Krumholzibacteria bacterium]
MRKVIIALSIVCAFSVAAGRAVAQEGTGGTRSVFSIGAGSRAIALGGAFSAIGNDASVLYYNPAALRLCRYPGAVLNHIQLFSGFSDATYDFLGLVYPTISAGSIGLGIMTVGTGGIRGYDEFSRETGELTYRESQVILGYALDLPWRYVGDVTAGASVKVLNQRVGAFSAAGTGLDIGLVYRPKYVRRIAVGCNLQDIVGAETKLVTLSDKVDRTIMVGAGYTYPFKNGSSLSLALQMNAPQRDKREFRVGAEYLFKNYVSVRVGYDSEMITAGLGVGWRGFSFDYGYFSRGDAGSSHPLTLSSRIGASIEEKIAAREQGRLVEEERRIQQILSKRISGHVGEAERYRKEGALGKALDELKLALEYDPTNKAVSDTLAVVERAILAAERASTQDAEKAALISRHFALGLDYYSKDDYVLSRAEWRNVLDLDSSNASAREYLGKTAEKLASLAEQHRVQAVEFERRGQLAAALGEWNVVRTLDPESAEAKQAADRINLRLDEMSRDYTQTSKRLKVMELFDGAVKAFGDGRYADASAELGELLRLEPTHEEARKLLLRSQRRMTPLTDKEKTQVRALYIDGMKFFTQGKYTSAIEQWKKILDIDPDNESVSKNIEEARKRLENTGVPKGKR